MKNFSKMLLAGVVAVVAIAISTAPSEAAKRRAKAPATCAPLTTCTMPKTGVVHQCWGDGKWQPMLLGACSGAGCPPPCPK